MRADTVDARSWLLPPQLTAIQRKQIIDTMTLARCNELTAQKLLLYVSPASCRISNIWSRLASQLLLSFAQGVRVGCPEGGGAAAAQVPAAALPIPDTILR